MHQTVHVRSLVFLVAPLIFFAGCKGFGPIEDPALAEPSCPQQSTCESFPSTNHCVCLPSHPDEREIATRLYNDLFMAAQSSPKAVVNASVTLWDYLNVKPEINDIETPGIEVYWVVPRNIPGHLETGRSSTSVGTLYERIKYAANARYTTIYTAKESENSLWVELQLESASQINEQLNQGGLQLRYFRITGTADDVWKFWVQNTARVRAIDFRFHPEESYWAVDPDMDIGRRYQGQETP